MKIIKVLLLGMALALGSLSAGAAMASGSEPAIQAMPDVNINQAGAAELAEALKGVGLSRANAIVAYRKSHGPFKSVEALANVKGIGASTLKRNRGHITLK